MYELSRLCMYELSRALSCMYIHIQLPTCVFGTVYTHHKTAVDTHTHTHSLTHTSTHTAEYATHTHTHTLYTHRTNWRTDSRGRAGGVLVVPAIHLLLVFQSESLEGVHVLNVLQSGPEVLYHIAHQRLDVLLRAYCVCVCVCVCVCMSICVCG